MIKQVPLGIGFPDDYSFANFVSDENQILVDTLQRSLQDDGECIFYLWGKPGTGKSHCLQACCHALGQRGAGVCYLPLRDDPQLAPEMLEGLEHMPLIAIDDVDAIAGNSVWEEALFHLYNRVRAAGGLLIVSGDASPTQLSIRLPDLRSRLAWGMVFQVHELSDTNKQRNLMLRAHERGMELSEAVASYCLNHCSRNMTHLMKLLDRLDHASLAEQRRLTIPLVKSVIEA